MNIKKTVKKLSALAVMIALVAVSAAFNTFAAVTATETNEVRWIDRLADIPEYAQDFYSWLENNSGENGALITAQDVTNANNNVHNIAVFSETLPLDCTDYDSQQAISENASQIVGQAANENFNNATEWISTVYGAFLCDHPEVFWLSGGSMLSYSYGYGWSEVPGTKNLTVTYNQTVMFCLKTDGFDIRTDIYQTPENILNTINLNEEAINNILDEECEQKSNYEKIIYFNKYLTENNYYNTVNLNNSVAHTAVSALQSKTGENAPVCEGYAKAFKILCDRADIPCVLITGYANNGSHMWNAVELDGKWYAVDVTWNDPLSINNFISGYENENYLLIGNGTLINNEIFSQSHIATNIAVADGFSFINGPVISEATYRSTLPHICTLNGTRCSYCDAVICDVNRDSQIDIFDLIALKKALLNTADNGNYDCNNDGIFNGMDLVALKRQILGLL